MKSQTDVSTMQPSRRLDALIAEEVLELRGVSQAIDVAEDPDWVDENNQSVPMITTGNTDFILVIDAMHKRFGFHGHNNFLLMHDDKEWYCEFPQPHWESAMGQTIGLAVGRAALKAVMGTLGNPLLR